MRAWTSIVILPQLHIGWDKESGWKGGGYIFIGWIIWGKKWEFNSD